MKRLFGNDADIRKRIRQFIRLRRRPRLRAVTPIEKESQRWHFGVQARTLAVEECVNAQYTLSAINLSCFGGFRSMADDPPKPWRRWV